MYLNNTFEDMQLQKENNEIEQDWEHENAVCLE